MNAPASILYLHGFASTGNATKAEELRRAFGSGGEVLSPTLDPDPEKAWGQISQILNVPHEQMPLLVVGSSLGGFYADYARLRFNVACVLVNPLVEPERLEPFVGTNRNQKTGEPFEFTRKDLDSLLQMKREKEALRRSLAPALVLVAEDDELLPFRVARDHYQSLGLRIVTVPQGGHRFENAKAYLKGVEATLQQGLLHFAHKLSSAHEPLIRSSKVCGCFFCGKLFGPEEIVDWVEEGSSRPEKPVRTALCPYCPVDSVLPESPRYRLDAAFLAQMREEYFANVP
ncbi:MAG: YqiA/YcfP family alpha/beta fold hydrolase [Spirochaetales bacterium]